MVEDVHRLRARLYEPVAADDKPLEQRKVGPPVARAAQRVARQVTERPGRWSRKGASWRADCRRVEPLILGLRTVRIPDQVWPVRSGVTIGRARLKVEQPVISQIIEVNWSDVASPYSRAWSVLAPASSTTGRTRTPARA